MQKPDSHTIHEATKKAKQQLSIASLQKKSKYKDITEQQYNELFECAQAFALLILESFTNDELIEQEL
ncbi:MAG: hypothetical protein PF517_12800 [Salinivirgaceae bacterium]|jgi:hypothetical protein|nr:hypothetical protein [Salinivirgaceae bacterium]